MSIKDSVSLFLIVTIGVAIGTLIALKIASDQASATMGNSPAARLIGGLFGS